MNIDTNHTRRGSLTCKHRCQQTLTRLHGDSNIFTKSLGKIQTLSKSDVEVGRTLGKGRFAEVKSISKLSSTSDSERIEKGESNDIVPMMRLDRNNFPSSSRNNSLLSDKDSKYQRYALKELRGSLSNSTHFVGAIDLAKEARFLLALSHHPNIVSLHYTGKDPGSRDYFIVIEELETTFDILIHKEWKILYDKKGSCRSHENTGNCIEKKKPRKKVLEDSRRELLKIRLETMLGIASAFEFLHAKHVLFRDIKPANIGISFDDVPQVFDFGLATELKEKNKTGDGRYLITPMSGTRRYMAPEVYLGESYGLPADVYSITLMLWEVLAIAVPFKKMNERQHAKFVYVANRRPKVERGWPAAMTKLLKRGWARDPKVRPTMEEFREIVHQVYVALKITG